MPAPEADIDDVSEVHSRCPFCGGEYAIGAGAVRHSLPTCPKFAELPPLAFRKAALDEEKKNAVEEKKKHAH